MPTDKHHIDGTLDAAAAEINELQRASGLGFVVTLGKLLVRHFFSGDVRLLHRRGPKTVSLSRLADRDDISFSASQLSRAVGVYRITQRAADIATSQYLHKSHFFEVLPLPDDAQDQLLRRADAERWSVDRLREEVAKLRPPKAPRQGRPPKHPVVKLAGSLDKALKPFDDLGELPNWSQVEHATLVATEAQLADAEETLRALLRSVREALVVPEPARPGKLDVDRPRLGRVIRPKG